MTFNSGSSVDVSLYRDLADTHSVVLNPTELDNRSSIYSQRSDRSVSTVSRIPGYSDIPLTDVSVVPDTDPPPYAQAYKYLLKNKPHPKIYSNRRVNSNRLRNFSGPLRNKYGIQPPVYYNDTIPEEPPSNGNSPPYTERLPGARSCDVTSIDFVNRSQIPEVPSVLDIDRSEYSEDDYTSPLVS